ncbi:MEDS domain-containing protein [Actinomycetes bacterium KLBMP 9797]
MLRLWISRAHVCVFYRADEELRQLLSVQFVSALERGERFVYLTDDQPAVDHLTDAAPEFELVARRGQALVEKPDGLRDPDGAFAPDRLAGLLSEASAEALRDGYLGLRACADMTSLSALPTMAAGIGADLLVQERRLNQQLAEGQSVGLTLTCHYDLRRVPRPDVSGLRPAHEMALTAEQALATEPLLRTAPLNGHAGLRVSGEIDRSNLPEFTTALATAFRPDEDFHLDLAELHYAGVAAVRVLADLADRLQRGRQLVVCNPGPIVRTILRAYGWDRLPALRLAEAGDPP